MAYRTLLFLVFFSISFNNLFAEDNEISDNVLSVDNLIKASLESEVFPNASFANRIILVVDEDIQNKALDTVLIPRYTRIICLPNEVKRLNNLDVVFAGCTNMFLPNGKSINFKGNILGENLKHGMRTPQNVAIPKGTQVLVQLEEEISVE